MAWLPFLTYVTLCFMLANLRPGWTWRQAALRGSLIWGAYALVVVEVLSLASLIRREALLVAWLIALAACLALLFARIRSGSPPRLPRLPERLGWPELALLAGIGLIFGLTALVAWFAPPQTWDSLNYHMARVAHWAQQGSVRHFATGIEVQNSRAPAAEFIVLHLYVLGGGDRLVNFVQWTAMVVSVMGATLIAAQLGARVPGQLAAGLYTATLPMGIVQASSTMTDYVVAMCLVGAGSELLRLRSHGPNSENLIFLTLATGLALATKPTAAPYLLPMAGYASYVLLRRGGLALTARWAVVGVAMVTALNAGHLGRNQSTYGALLDPAQVALHSNELRDLRGVASNLLRSAAIHAGTPSPHVNKALALAVQWTHRAMGLDPNDPRTTAHGTFKITVPTTNEDKAGNPLHAYLFVALTAYLALKRKELSGPIYAYLVLLALAALGFSFLFKWQAFASRYHLPLFVLAAPAAGLLLERMLSGPRLALAGGLMVLAAWPWLLQIKSRPLVAISGDSYVASILTEPRARLYVANGLNLLEPYSKMTDEIRRSDCANVAIALGGNAAEYPIWAYLGAPRADLRIEWMVAGTPSERYRDLEFRPCALICEGCPEGSPWELPMVYEHGAYRLYLEGGTSSP